VPIVGLAQRNPKYKPVRPGSSWAAHKPRSHDDFGIPGPTAPSRRCNPNRPDPIPALCLSTARARARSPRGGVLLAGCWLLVDDDMQARCLVPRSCAEGYDDGSHISSGEVGLNCSAALPPCLDVRSASLCASSRTCRICLGPKSMCVCRGTRFAPLAGVRQAALPQRLTRGEAAQVDKVPLDTGLATQIFVNVSIGTPRQPLKVILDTGSSVLAVFCGATLPRRPRPRLPLPACARWQH
jgi:hypothetical protein